MKLKYSILQKQYKSLYRQLNSAFKSYLNTIESQCDAGASMCRLHYELSRDRTGGECARIHIRAPIRRHTPGVHQIHSAAAAELRDLIGGAENP